MIVKIREIIRDCITFGMHFIYTRIYQMNIDKSAKLSFGAILDKSNPKGVHIGEESFIASGAVILCLISYFLQKTVKYRNHWL